MKFATTAGRWATAAAIAVSLTITAAPARAETITREAAIANLNQHPLYPALAKYYPATYARLVDDLVAGINSGRPYGQLIGELNDMVTALVFEQTPKATVENTLALLSLNRDQAKATLALDPAYCLSLLGMRKLDIGLVQQLPRQLIDREAALMAKVLEQTSTRPDTTPPADLSETQILDLGVRAYDQLASDQLRVAFAETEGEPDNAVTPLQQTAHCEYTIEMLDILLAMPPVEGARTFKALFAQR